MPMARIVFDTEEPIDTPPIFNTLDAAAPSSHVLALPGQIEQTTFEVSWSGEDDANGSAIADYTILVSKDGGPATVWLSHTTLTNALFTAESGHSYSFSSVARDNSGNEETAPGAPDATLTVGEPNQAPTDIALSNAAVNENSPAGTVVGSLSATDPDTGDSFTYTLSDNPGGYFAIDGANLVVATPLDRELAGSRDVTVRVTDSAHNTFDQTFSIAVGDVNDTAPAITTAGTQTVAENTTHVAVLGATDADFVGASPPAFSITGGADATKFEIVAGNLQFKTAPDYEAGQPSYSVEVTANDGANAAAKTITVNVTDVNEAPVVANAITDQNVAEDTLWSYQVPANAFADVDNANLSYTAALGNGDALPDWLSFSAGSFSGTPPLNFNGAFDLTVTASDGALSASDTFTLTVTAANDAPTAVTLVNMSGALVENTSTTTHIKVADIVLTDDGLGNSVLGLAGADAVFFEISGTSLYLKAGTVLDFESKASYAVAVTADDPTVGASIDATSATYTLALVDVAEAPAAISPAIKVGPEFLVNTTTFRDQTNPAAAKLNDGFVIVWEDRSQEQPDGSGRAIRAQRFDQDNHKVGSEILVTTGFPSTELAPSVTRLANGGFVVTWADRDLDLPADTSGTAIKGLFFSELGAPVGTEFVINTSTQSDQLYPASAALTNGNFVVTWHDNASVLGNGGPDNSGSSVKAQIFDAEGGRLGGELQVNTTYFQYQMFPTVAATANGGFAIAWRDASNQGGDSSDTSIKARTFDAAGNGLSAEFLVNSFTFNSQEQPSIAVLANGNLAITWVDVEGSGGDGSGTGIKGKVIAPTGATVASEFLVNTATAFGQVHPHVVTLGTGGFVVIWMDGSGDTDDTSIKGQLYNQAGARIGGEFRVETTVLDHQELPSVAALAGGEFVVTWRDWSGLGGDSSERSIKAQILTVNRAPTDISLSTNAVAENSALGTTVGTLAATDPDSGEIFAFSLVDNVGGRFALNGSTLIVAGALDHEASTSHQIVVRLTDSFHHTFDKAFTIGVSNVNESPTSISLTNAVVTENSAAGTVVGALSATDPDAGDTVALSLVDDAGGRFAIADGRLVIASPLDFELASAHQVTVRATDSAANFFDQIFTIVIANANDAPIVAVAIPDQSVAEDMAWSYQVPAGTFTDVDGDALSYAATLGNGDPLPGWLSFAAATRTFSGTPPLNFNGALDLKVTASDGTLAAADTFTLTVTAVNDAPAVAVPIPDQSVAEDTAWSYQVPAGAFTDVDGDALSYAATLGNGDPLPGWLSFTTATRTFSGTPPLNFNGALDLKVTASDGTLAAADTFTLTVTAVNDAPAVAVPIPDQSVAEDTAWSYQVPAGAFTDVDGDVLSYSATRGDGDPLPGWLSFTPATRTFAGTPPLNFNGALDLKVIVSDGTLGDSDTFSFSVSPVNDTPVLSNSGLRFPRQSKRQLSLMRT